MARSAPGQGDEIRDGDETPVVEVPVDELPAVTAYTLPQWTTRHLWHIQPVRDVLVVVSVIGFFWLGARLSIVTVPFLVALLLAYLFDPLIRRLGRVPFLSRRSASATIAVLIGVLVTGVIVLALAIAAVQTARLARSVTTSAGEVMDSVHEPASIEKREAVGAGAWLVIRDSLVEMRGDTLPEGVESSIGGDAVRGVLTWLGIETRDVAQLLERAIDLLRNNPSRVAQQAIETGTGAVGSALGLLGAAGSFLFGLFLTVFFFFFFADRWSSVVRFAQSLLPDKNRERALELASKMNRAIAGFVRGRLIIGLILAGFYTIGFAFMGVPAPLLLGFAIAALALIPYAVIAGMPVVILLLWLESHSGFRGEVWWIIGAPIAYYNIGQLLDDYLLTPVIQGKATDLATPEIVFASVAAGTLFGIFGLLVAIPLAACLKILIVEVAWPKYKAWSEGKRPDALPLE